MKIFRHVVLALIVMAPLLLANFDQAKAGVWYSPSGHYWTISPVCRNGVEITLMEKYANDMDYVFTLEFVAYELHRSTARSQPQKHEHPVTTDLSKLSAGEVTEFYHEVPFYWTDDEAGTSGNAFVYGSSKLDWDALPVGSAVMVKRPGDDKNFVGAVTRCWL